VTYSYFYFEKFSIFYSSDNLQELNFNLYIEGTDTPYTISNSFASRSSFTITPTITDKVLNISAS